MIIYLFLRQIIVLTEKNSQLLKDIEILKQDILRLNWEKDVG